jgi:hypothetical protein
MRGFGIIAASFSINSMGEKWTARVPSRHAPSNRWDRRSLGHA